MREQISIIFFLCIICVSVNAQEDYLSLEQAIGLSRQQSFDAFKAKNLYLIQAINYETYLKSLYPKMDLSLTPANFSHSIEEQWNSSNARYEPYDLQSLTSKGSLTLDQPIKLLGGTVTLNSYLYRYCSYKDGSKNYTTYISYPFRITYSQDLLGVNSYKWVSRTAPLEFEKAKKEYIESVEAISTKVVQFYFELLIADKDCEISQLNLINADTLFQIAKTRQDLGLISEDEYLQLKLRKVNASIDYEQKLEQKDQARISLNNLLDLPLETDVRCEVPSNFVSVLIDRDFAVVKAFENNPNIIDFQNKLIEANQTLKSTKADRLSSSFSATVGFNQNQDSFKAVYVDLEDQQSISFTLSVPIVDWGDAKREIVKAKLNQELAEENIRSQKNTIKIEIINLVNSFYISQKQVASAILADSISHITYQLIQQQYIHGKTGIMDLNSSYNDLQSSQNNYLNSLMNYWINFYSIRKICLYDFEKQMDLNADFDQLLDNLK